MSTVIFVHGTGVREPNYTNTFNIVKSKLEKQVTNVTRCYWGGKHGVQLFANGASIPEVPEGAITTRSIDNLPLEDFEVQLWHTLYEDPSFELNLLTLREFKKGELPPGHTPGRLLLEDISKINSSLPELTQILKEPELADIFNIACQQVRLPRDINNAIAGISPEVIEEIRLVYARAIVAKTIALCLYRNIHCQIAYNPTIRDRVVVIIATKLGATNANNEISDRGVVSDWLKKQVITFASDIATNRIKQKRAALTSSHYPFAGDIVLYQARGEAIREYIKCTIAKASKPVILLAHSLGGIASVDLLMKEALEVSLLITVGSQAPLLYELNALSGKEFERVDSLKERLPEHFPKWLNIYDSRDFLSYIGAGIFGERVTDVHVDNRQPFPMAHTSYWYNEAFWKEIYKWLPSR